MATETGFKLPAPKLMWHLSFYLGHYRLGSGLFYFVECLDTPQATAVPIMMLGEKLQWSKYTPASEIVDEVAAICRELARDGSQVELTVETAWQGLSIIDHIRGLNLPPTVKVHSTL